MTALSAPAPRRRFRFTGWHMLAILVGFFGIVIAVNVYMAMLASETFSGVVVENSYVASQHYNHWLDEAAKERALGWNATVSRQIDGHLAVSITGAGSENATLTAEAWHPLGQLADRNLTFRKLATGSYVSNEALPEGRWRLRLALNAGGHVWRTNERL
ncbi:MAG TPA: FixH family protein [Novosphingobium sp.]|nr:FixH family protein [Novosphingobium sp.]HZV10517.1 FixH family protein [Novosphingobium sp.]